MRITGLRVIALRFPMVPPVAFATRLMKQFEALLVFVDTDEGIVGVSDTKGPVALSRAAIEHDIAPMLVGEDPRRIEYLWQKVHTRTERHGRKGVVMHALSAIDIALWDIQGQIAGVPIHQLLGSCHEKLVGYASGGAYCKGKTIADLAAECRGYVAQGFRAMKVKVGRQRSAAANDGSHENDRNAFYPDSRELRVTFDEDVKRVQAVRDAIGPDVGLAIDANNAWDLATAQRFCAAVEDCNLLWVEEPLPTDNLESSAELARSVAVPIAGYESETGLQTWRDVISKGAVDIVQPAITYCGGFSGCTRIGAVAEAYGLPYTPHSFLTAVTQAASVHLAASLPNARFIEVGPHAAMLNDLVENPIKIESDGTLRPPNRPGLGVQLRADTIERYRFE